MKYSKEYVYNFPDRTAESYVIDKQFAFDDLKDFVNAFSKSTIIIERVVVREFGDYEDAPDVIRYRPSIIDEINDDFAGKRIESYDLICTKENRKILLCIDPDHRCMQIKYHPQDQKEIHEIIQELNEQAEKGGRCKSE